MSPFDTGHVTITTLPHTDTRWNICAQKLALSAWQLPRRLVSVGKWRKRRTCAQTQYTPMFLVFYPGVTCKPECTNSVKKNAQHKIVHDTSLSYLQQGNKPFTGEFKLIRPRRDQDNFTKQRLKLSTSFLIYLQALNRNFPPLWV